MWARVLVVALLCHPVMAAGVCASAKCEDSQEETSLLQVQQTLLYGNEQSAKAIGRLDTNHDGHIYSTEFASGQEGWKACLTSIGARIGSYKFLDECCKIPTASKFGNEDCPSKGSAKTPVETSNPLTVKMPAETSDPIEHVPSTATTPEKQLKTPEDYLPSAEKRIASEDGMFFVTVYRGTGNSQRPSVVAEKGFLPRPPYTVDSVNNLVGEAVKQDIATTQEREALNPRAKPATTSSATYKLALQHQKTKDTGLISTALHFFDAYQTSKFFYRMTGEIAALGHKPLDPMTRIADAAAFQVVDTEGWGIKYKTGSNIEMMFSQIPTSWTVQWLCGSANLKDEGWKDLSEYKEGEDCE